MSMALACGGSEDRRSSGDTGILSAGIDTDDFEATDGTQGADGHGEHGDGHGDDGIKFDIGDQPGGADGGNVGCGGDTEGVKLSYIWIANSSQGTISKIDTVTMIEEGRYYAKPAGGDPSRTSVNLSGDVAVANRNGGVAKFWADVDHCVESNGVPGIQTSTGANDILAWGQDECLAWYTPLNCGSNRPVAWTRGTWNEATCRYEDAKLWTACDAQVHLLDGETGAIEQTVVLPAGGAFVYGGAADADGNFWGLDFGGNGLFRVDFGDMSVGSWGLPASSGYGITVDAKGRPWLCGGGGASRFNIDTATWSSTGHNGIGGCMTDGASTLWHSDYGSGMLNGYDIDSLALVQQIQLPQYVHGVSVDFYGKVWGVSFASTTAYRADPVTGTIDTYAGLTGAYTYSDMTGFALSTAGGGGQPPG
jgi:hypothetical protein